MSLWAFAFLIVFEDFQPVGPARTSLCGISWDFLSSWNASIRMSRFLRGSIVPMWRMYGCWIFGKGGCCFWGSMLSYVVVILALVLYFFWMSCLVVSDIVRIASAFLMDFLRSRRWSMVFLLVWRCGKRIGEM